MTQGREFESHAPRPFGRRAAMILGAWSLAALAVAASGVLERAPRPVVPALIGGGTALLVALWLAVPAVREWSLGIDLRIPILYNALRAPIGVAFLALHARGELSGQFALLAGWGDLAAGLLAFPAARAWTVHTRASRLGVKLWNLLGLADILAVIATAQVLLFTRPDTSGLELLRRFPGSLLPTIVVPLVVASHLLVIAKLRATRVDARRRAGD